MQKFAWTCVAAASLAAALVTPAAAQMREGGPGAAIGQRGERPAAKRQFTPAPRATIQRSGPAVGARIEPRLRSGGVDRRRDNYRAGVNAHGAAPLTITRNESYATGRRHASGGRYYVRDRWSDGSWLPGLLAAPFLLPGYLLGGGWGYNGYYDDDYAPASYPYGGYDDAPVYAGASYGGELGNFCATPQKVCQLYSPAEVGLGCSCRAPAGLPRFRGTVVP